MSGDRPFTAWRVARREWTGIGAIDTLWSKDSSLEFARGRQMALQEPQAEPSMEEILASIRRIISEEDRAPAGEAVLDLTQAEPTAPPPADNIVLEAVEHPPAARQAVAPPPAVRAAAPAPIEGAMLSGPTTHAAVGALARLAGSLRISDAPSQTVEGVVRELLQPMLKDWLDHNLPAIVEAKVEAELDRIARLAR